MKSYKYLEENQSSDFTFHYATTIMNTEEGFILASLKEFVKLWGSGSQSSYHLECKNGQAWFQFGSHPVPSHRSVSSQSRGTPGLRGTD